VRSRSWLLGILLLVTVVVSIGPPVIGIGSFHAADMIGTMPPWSEQTPYDFVPDNTHVSDTVNALVPMRASFRDRVRSGDLPLWDPLQGTGAPAAVVPNVGVFSPLTLPYLIAPLWLAPMLTKLLEMGVAALGMILLLRRWGLGRPAAIVGALAFVNSAFLVVWTNWPQSHVGALIPLVFWAVERGVTSPRLRQVWPLAAVGAVMWLEGFPSVTIYALVTAGIYALVRVVAVYGTGRRALARLAALAGAVVLSAGLAALQLLPFFQYLQTLNLNRQGVAGTPLSWEYLATLAVPDALGNPVERVYYGPLNYVEGQSWVGVVTLILLALLIAGRHRLALPRGVFTFLVTAGIVGLVVVYFGTPLLTAIGRIPLIGTNFIGRYRAVLGVLVAAGAAAGYQAFVTDGEVEVRRVLTVLGGLCVAMLPLAWIAMSQASEVGRLPYAAAQAVLPLVVAALAVVVVVGRAIQRPPSAGALAVTAVVAGGALPALVAVQSGVAVGSLWQALQTPAVGLIVGGVGVVVLVLLVSKIHSRGATTVAAIALPLLLAIEAVSFASPWWARTPTDQFYPQTETHAFLEANLGIDRFAAADSTLYPGTNLMYGLRSVTAHTQLPSSVREFYTAIDPDVYARSSSFPFLSTDEETATSPLLDRVAAKYWAVGPLDPLYGDSSIGVAGDVPLVLGSGDVAGGPISAGPLRGVTLTYLGSTGLAGTPKIVAEVRTSQGQLVASGSTRLHRWVSPGPLPVALGEIDVPEQAELVVRLEDAETGEVRLASDGAQPSYDRVEPSDDGLQLVHHEGAVVYARTAALPRIRWAGRAVIAAQDNDLALLASGLDDDVVVLQRDSAADVVPSAGAVQVIEDSGDVIVVEVAADGDGFVVVADGVQSGWHAQLDGQQVPILTADHAFGAVAVPEGVHEIRLTYDPPGWGIGRLITALSVAVLLALAVAERRSKRASRGSRTRAEESRASQDNDGRP
jgi:hypothetical protein